MIRILVLSILAFSVSVYAQQGVNVDQRPFAVLDLDRNALQIPPVDLVCETDKCGEFYKVPLFPDAITKLVQRGVIKDSSELNPTSDSLLWAASIEAYPPAYRNLWNTLNFPIDPNGKDELGFQNEGETFNYTELKPDGFNNQTSIYLKSQKDSQDYNIRLGSLVHNNLMRKSLLRRIGYFIPPVQYLKTFKVHFPDEGRAKEQKIDLIKDIYSKSNDPQHWIRNISDETFVCILTPPPTPDSVVIGPNDNQTMVEDTLENGQVVQITLREQKEKLKVKLQAELDKCTNLTDNLPATLEVRGGVVYKGLDDIAYNLSRGSLGTDGPPIILGRRLLNSVIIPFTIVDAVPQLDLFENVAGREFDRGYMINHEEGDLYRLPPEDVKWMLRLLSKLQRQDYLEIARAGNFQIENSAERAAYEQLLAEKMMSRLTAIAIKMGFENEFKHLNPDTKLTVPGLIEKGLLAKDVCSSSLPITCWEPLPTSPLDRKELFAFGKSILLSNVFNEAVKYFNQEVIPASAQRTETIGKALEYHNLVERPAEQFASCLIATKQGNICEPLAKETWSKWYKNIGLIFSRNTVFGSFLGADYPIQLADTIGFVVSGGVFLSRDGMPSGQSLIGDVSGSYLMTYTHLKGTLSIAAANKEPIKNVFVPGYKRKRGHILEDVSEAVKTYKKSMGPEELHLWQIIWADGELNDKEKERLAFLQDESVKVLAGIREGRGIDPAASPNVLAKIATLQNDINAAVKVFKDNFGVQESVIITKSMGPKMAINFAKLLKHEILGGLTLNGEFQHIKRLNVTRPDENTIQIFENVANKKTGGIDPVRLSRFGIRIAEPFNISSTRGSAETKFFSLNLESDLEKNPRIIEHAAALAKVLLTNDVKHLYLLEKNENPQLTQKSDDEKDEDDCSGLSKKAIDRTAYNFHSLCHKFRAPENESAALMWETKGQKIIDDVEVILPNDFKKEMTLTTKGRRWGRNIQDFALQVLNAYIQEETDLDFDVAVQTNENPGDTIFGKARSRRASFEAEKLRIDGQKLTSEQRSLKDSFGSVEHSWHGWEISGDKLRALVAEQEARYGKITMFPHQKLQNIESDQLYTLLISVKFYEQAIDNMAKLSRDQIRDIFSKHSIINLNVNHETGETEPKRLGPIRLAFVTSNFDRAKEKYKKFKDSDPKKAARAALHMVDRAEALLDRDGLSLITGGPNEIFIEASIDGFKIGDPTGYRTVIGDTQGQINSTKKDGPLKDLMHDLRINVGEFYIYWLLNKL